MKKYQRSQSEPKKGYRFGTLLTDAASMILKKPISSAQKKA
jgi:hypothetical protein